LENSVNPLHRLYLALGHDADERITHLLALVLIPTMFFLFAMADRLS
jgi:hypothetical protein